MQDNQPYIIGKRRKITMVRWGRVLFAVCLVCAAVCVTVVLLSGGKSYIKQKENYYYYVQLGEFASANLAEEFALSTKTAGGSGYIISGSTYRVMASVYKNSSDADTVVARLNEGGNTASVYRLTLPALKMPAPDDEKEKIALMSALSFPFNTFDSLYEISLQLDKSEISESLALLKITNLIASAEAQLSQLIGFNSPIIKQARTVNLSILSSIKNIDVPGQSKTAVKIKYALCEMTLRTAEGIVTII